ncbi:MAG: VOC family protein [Arthrobacter sp.]
MLRVRPIHFTSRLDEWERLLTGLGLVKTVDEPTWREFDAGSGRLALHFVEQGSADDGTTSLGVEVGDLKEFARRTKESGAADGASTAELIDADHGPSCRVTAADGFSFLADPATRASDGTWGGSPEADPSIAVVGVWFSEDAVAAARTLRNIGARPRPVPGSRAADAETDNVESEAFTAKNGGILMVGAGTGAGSAGLGFEYAGDLGALRQRLEEAGQTAAVLDDAPLPTLHVANPDADGATARPPLWISMAPAAG